jgi:molecular chaperone Hsp33
MVVDVSSEGTIRACARLKDPNHPLFTTQTQATVQQLFGGGNLAFTIDQVNTDDRYQGVVDLRGETLSQCMHHFFRQSEQLETGIVIASCDFTTSQEKKPLVAALMVQRLPLAAGDDQEESDDLWVKTLSALGTLSTPELLSPDLGLSDILYRLFWEEGVRLYKEKNLHFRCRCSQSKIHELLRTFSVEHLKEMVVDDKIQVNCEFCNEKYDFTLDAVHPAPVPLGTVT